MKVRSIPTDLDLNEISFYFEYRDGMTFWKNDKPPNVRAGDRAGCHSKGNRHRQLTLNFNKYLESHVIWFLETGRWVPTTHVIDHLDENPANNDISNLTARRHADSVWHKEREKKSATGVKGVYVTRNNAYTVVWTAGPPGYRKPRNKTFYWSKYGKEKALQLAISHRKYMEILHY